MAHTIEMNSDGILRITMNGNFGKSEGENFYRDMSLYLDAATAENPVHNVIDISGMKMMSSAARKYFFKLNDDPRYGLVGMVNAPRAVIVLTRFILRASGRTNIDFFDSTDNALDWINSTAIPPNDLKEME